MRKNSSLGPTVILFRRHFVQESPNPPLSASLATVRHSRISVPIFRRGPRLWSCDETRRSGPEHSERRLSSGLRSNLDSPSVRIRFPLLREARRPAAPDGPHLLRTGLLHGWGRRSWRFSLAESHPGAFRPAPGVARTGPRFPELPQTLLSAEIRVPIGQRRDHGPPRATPRSAAGKSS